MERRRLTYEELVRALFPRLTGGIRWGLERTERMLASVGDPHLRYRTIHVGGTNGKGSVAATIASVLRSSGLRTGLYTSPHLCTFRERIRVDGVVIREEALLEAAHRLWPAVERESPSFFEATTAVAFEALAAAAVDVAVVEVGLGGRLDATNVIRPELVVLTNVERDHVEYLGDTLGEIATEKAGIIKPGAAVATAETRPELLDVFRRRSTEVGAALRVLPRASVSDVTTGLGGTSFRQRTQAWGELRLHTPLVGPHQALNAALAVCALELLPEGRRPDRSAVFEGTAGVRWPGRLQVEVIDGRPWLFDAAHNPSGVDALLEALELLDPPRPLTAIVGILRDKDWESMLEPIGRFADRVVLTLPPTAPSTRRWDPKRAAAYLRTREGVRAEALVEVDFGRALHQASERVPESGGAVLVTGSIHTVGDALVMLGRAPDGTDAHLPLSAGAV